MSLTSQLASLVTILVIVNCVNGNGFTCPSTETSFHPDFSDCTRYWTCYRGVAFRQWCPMGLHFDREHFVCGFPDQVDCTGCPTTGIASIKINCNSYRLCINGQDFTKSCPAGTFFDESEGECNIIRPGENPCPFEACRGLANGVILQRNPEDCSVYYICVDGRIGATRNCPAGTWFGNATCVGTQPPECIAGNNGNGNGAIRFNVPRAGKKKASLTIGCPSEGNSVILSQGDCRKYSICSAGMIIEEKVCPEGLFFSEDLGVCSPPAMASCPY